MSKLTNVTPLQASKAAEQSKMIGKMKYQADKGVKEAQDALVTYRQLNREQKDTFLQDFLKAKVGKGGFGFAKAYEKSFVEETKTNEETVESWYTRRVEFTKSGCICIEKK